MTETLAQRETDDVRVRTATIEDVPTIARLHREGIVRGFLSQLGDPVLELLYRAFVEDPESVVLVAETEGRVVGFANGHLSIGRFYRRFFRRYGLRTVGRIGARLFRPSVLRRALETARYPRSVERLPEAEWIAISIDPATRTRGLGATLTRGVIDGLCALGAGEVKTTVEAANEPVNRLSRKLGFELRTQISVHDDRPSNVYVIRCRSS